MANYSNIRNKIISDIKPNNNQEITGQIMQDTLLQMVSLLQDGGYLFKGGATTTTNPIVGDSNVFYLASVKGTYANFGGLQVNDNELAALVYNGSWSKISIDNQIAHLKDIWNVEYLPVFFLRVEFSNDTIAKISIDDVITTDFEAIIDDLINKTAFIFAYNSVNGSSEVNEFLSPVSVRKTEAGDSVEFIFDGINRNRYRVVVNYKDLSIQNQARQLIFLPNVSTFQDGLMSKEDKTKLDGIEVGANKYTLPVATASILGGIKSGGDVSIGTDGTVTVNNATNVENVPVATTSKIGGIKAGAYITVNSDGSVIIQRASTADNAENDENGDNILGTYAKKTELPKIATSTVAGIIKGGGDIAVAADGSVTVNNAGVAQMAMQDSSGRVIVNTYVPKTQVATSSAAGLVKSGNDISVASDGTVTVTSATTVDNVPAATSSKIGGVKSGGDILVSSTGEVTVNNAASAEEAVHATRADNATNVTNVPVATASALGGVKSGGDISVGSDGTVSASGKALRITNGGVALYYKFMSFDIGGDKGMIRFGIVSPLLGYGEFMINWGWQGTTEEKHCNPYCVFSTGSQMYNRVKLVRTGGRTFDAYFASNSGNDYATFVFMGQSGTSVKSFSASGVSSIPTVYRESAYVGNLYFGKINATNVENVPVATTSKIGGVVSGGDIIVSSSGKVTVNNANTLQGHGIVEAGETSVKNKIPVIGNDGVMEIGRYLDFHMDGSTEDYNLRLSVDSTTKHQIYLPAKTGTMALTSDIPSFPFEGVIIVEGKFDQTDHWIDFSTKTGNGNLEDQVPLFFQISQDPPLDQRACIPLSYSYDVYTGNISFWFVSGFVSSSSIYVAYGSGSIDSTIQISVKQL